MSTIPAAELGHSEFRILFHLCDCHNPSMGCFPSQEYLRATCGVSNGTLNNSLRSLEEKGLIRREKQIDPVTKRQLPTRYVLGFEMAGGGKSAASGGDGSAARTDRRKHQERAKPTPENGDGIQETRLQRAGDGAVSNPDHDPSPTETTTRLQPTGDITCKEPGNNHGAVHSGHSRTLFFTDDERFEAREIADHIGRGGGVRADAVPQRIRQCLVAEKMITGAQADALGIR
nr:helix-turn-helix domain-containing protein [Mangrovicoccus sp. HB161399]